jgi:hypothetical protein
MATSLSVNRNLRSRANQNQMDIEEKLERLSRFSSPAIVADGAAHVAWSRRRSRR